MILRLTLAFALCAVCCPAAQPAPQLGNEIVLEADRGPSYDQRTGEVTLNGNARLSDGTLLLLADEIRYSSKTETATAVGRVAFTRGNLRMLADRLVYNRTTGEFAAENIRLGSHPYFIEGFSASGTRDEITVKRARASYGEPGPWQPTINADTIVFAPDRALRSENVTLGIGHAQPVPIPRFDYSLSAPLIGTASLHGGFRRSLGLFVEAALHVPVHPSLRLGADLGIYTERGFLIGPSGRYSDFKDPDRLRGYFRSGYINDHGDKGVDNVYNRPIPEHRAYAEWQHQQRLAPNLTLAAQAHWWKDPEIYRDFRSRYFFPLQEPDTFVESVYTGDNYFLSAFARLQPNRFHRVQERLPEIRFDLLPSPLAGGIYQRAHASFVHLREDPLDPSATSFSSDRLPATVQFFDPTYHYLPTVTSYPFVIPLRSDRLNAYYGLSRPVAVKDWLAFTPVAGAQVTHYANARGAWQNGVPFQEGDTTRRFGEIGFDALLRSSGIFDYKNEQWKIDGLRHLLTPRLSYRYIAARGDATWVPMIDRPAFSTYLQPLGLGDLRHIDGLRGSNTLRVSLDNVLQTRDTADGTRDLLALNLANDFAFRRGEPHDNTGLHSELIVTPARWLAFDFYQSFLPRSSRLREFNSGVTIRDARYWAVRFSNNFLRDQIQDYLLDGRIRINERLDWQTRLHYDARRRRLNEQSYGLVQNLGNTWLISYNVSVYSGRRRESSFGFNVRVDTVRF